MFKLNFLKNQTITADELNTLGYNLANTVITTFTDGTLYGTDDLNEITKHLMHKGIKKGYNNECNIMLTDTGIYIDSGLAFFECGATIEVDNDGINLAFEDSSSTQYVYFFFDVTNNVGGARCTTSQPTGDYVLLGEIKDGVADTSNRNVAYMKNAGVLPNMYKTIEGNIKAYYVTKYQDEYYENIYDIGGAFKKFLLVFDDSVGNSLLFLDFENDIYINTLTESTGIPSSDRITIQISQTYNAIAYATLTAESLKISAKLTGITSADYTGQYRARKVTIHCM